MTPEPRRFRRRPVTHTIFLGLGVTIVTGFVGWLGVEVVENHDHNIAYIHTSEQVDKIIVNQKEYGKKMDTMLVFISQNRMDVSNLAIELTHCKKDVEDCQKKLEQQRSIRLKQGH